MSCSGRRGGPATLQGGDECRQQLFPIPQQHGIKERGERFGVGCEHRTAAEYDWILVTPLRRPDRNPLTVEHVRQHGAIQFPAQGESKQVAATVQGVALIGEQASNIHVSALGEGGPDHLISQARDPNRVGARESQHSPKSIRFRYCRIKQQCFLVQRLPPSRPLSGSGGGVNGRRCRSSLICSASSTSSSIPIWRS